MKNDYRQWSELAFQYGPFFFSLLFMVYLVGSRAKAYSKACQRHPPAAADEQSTLKKLLYWSFAVGVVLVGISVIWWLWYRPALYAFQGTVHNLRSYEHVGSPGRVYFKSTYADLSQSANDQMRDEVFVATKRTPFRDLDSITVEFWKGSGTRTVLTIDFVPDEEPVFVVEWDEGQQRNVIKRISSRRSSSSRGWWLHQAYAQAALQEVVPERGAGEYVKTPSSSQDRGCVSTLATLQDTHGDVGTKIVALESLEALNDQRLRECVRTRTRTESGLITVLDLTRHSDPELASKARRVASRMNVDEFVTSGLKSPNAEMRKDAEATLLRLERSDAERLAAAAGVKLAPKVEHSLAISQVGRTPRPTGSPQGDRYYVSAKWSPSSAQVVECLTRLFSAELISNRTIEQERTLMKNRRERVVYWYSPEWANMIATQIESCGGHAEFVVQ